MYVSVPQMTQNYFMWNKKGWVGREKDPMKLTSYGSHAPSFKSEDRPTIIQYPAFRICSSKKLIRITRIFNRKYTVLTL
jgi:hypothetical protein